jgi:hypothetical protein
VRLVLENLLSVLVLDRRSFSVYVCVVENVEDFDAYWGVDGLKLDEARSALSKFEANPDGFATGFGRIGIAEAIIIKEYIQRE